MQTLWSPWPSFFPGPLERDAMDLRSNIKHFLDLVKVLSFVFYIASVFKIYI